MSDSPGLLGSFTQYARGLLGQPEQRSVMDPEYQPQSQMRGLLGGAVRGAMDVVPIGDAMGGLRTMPLVKMVAQRLGIPLETASELVERNTRPQGSPFDANARAASSAYDFGRAATNAAPAIGAQMASSAPTRSAPQFSVNQDGQIVWHGSPHKFDKFDSSKIGTGEGAQAYGHGSYVASEPSVAKQYADTLGYKGATNAKGDQFGKYELASFFEDALKNSGVTGDAAKRQSLLWADKFADGKPLSHSIAADVIKSKGLIPQSGGNMYKVDLSDDQIAKMLDWDKPLSQQADSVRFALEPMFGPSASTLTGQELYKKASGFDSMVNVASKIDGNVSRMKSVFPQATDAQIEQAIAAAKKAVSNDKIGAGMLRDAGIPGIRYLDGGYRGAGAGTSNFVVFPGNESLLQILERNGVPIK